MVTLKFQVNNLETMNDLSFIFKVYYCLDLYLLHLTISDKYNQLDNRNEIMSTKRLLST